MARRSKFSLEFTPNYGLIQEPDCITIKLYYNGRLKSSGTQDEYTGGSIEYFDFVDLDKFGMIELWGFAEDLGFKDKDSIKFWHKGGKRHLHSNMKYVGFKSLAIKIALWAAEKETTIEDFRQRMEELNNIDHNAYEWLAKKPEDQWSKLHFSTIPKSDILLNNICESFNSCVLDARDKPNIEMFESIQNLLMNRFLLNREKAEKWKSQICPKIRDLLAKIYMDAATYFPMKLDEMHYQITSSDDQLDQHSVDLSIRTCSCRKWDLTGIPCKHAVCAIWCKKDNPEAYAHHCYLTETYRRCYALPIMPINGPNLWPACDLPPPLPPIYKEKIGRPAKLQRREPDEPFPASSQKNAAAENNKLKGAKRYNKCRICSGPGHNQRTCKGNDDVHQRGATQQEETHNKAVLYRTKLQRISETIHWHQAEGKTIGEKATSSWGAY